MDLAAELAPTLAAWHRAGARVVGINGAQGSGKSTLAAALVPRLAQHGLRAVVLALDDLYLGHETRLHLAHKVHALLATRGVPGTHDVALGLLLIDRLKSLGAGEPLSLPCFSKAEDDRLPEAEWPVVEGPVDLTLFEGWCVGTPPQSSTQLLQPINPLEAGDDLQGHWRRFVNARLATEYDALFARLDRLIFLRAPDFETVFAWRLQQEAGNAREGGSGKGLMSEAQLRRFIQHYERLTRHALAVLPARADLVVELAADRSARVKLAAHQGETTA